MLKLSKIIVALFWYGILAMIAIGIALYGGYYYAQSTLPDVQTLNTVKLQVPLRIYTRDKQLLAEFGEMRRIPVPFKDIPKPLIHALLATEDQRFYEHPGVDVFGLMRAAVEVARTGEKAQGGSTITMQVARNFFLDRKKTYARKVHEILLAIKIDRALPKDKILELYLNQIYFGSHAYGVAAAAEVYYGKTLNQLTLAQMAMLAGLPQAPSTVNPLANPTAALARRNHVLERMADAGFITKKQLSDAMKEPVTARYHTRTIPVAAAYLAEMVRQDIVDRFGKEVYTNGYQVYTTIDSRNQMYANYAVKHQLMVYDRKHGYRGPERHLGNPNHKHVQAWRKQLANYPVIAGFEPSIIVDVADDEARAMQSSGETIIIPWSGLSWARKRTAAGLGPMPKQAREVVEPGDLVYTAKDTSGQWSLAQLPAIEGALVAMDPHNGAIRALVGGFDFDKSSYNRSTQAMRQPGSSIKPFIYAAALNKGFTLASIVNDAPIVIDDRHLDTLWRPQNDNKRFYGPTRLRLGLVKSTNLITIRLLQDIGIPFGISFLEKFGFEASQLPQALSLALGTLNATPLQMATAYSVIANGGYRVTPYYIDRVTDGAGHTLLQAAPAIACTNCATKTAPSVIDAQTAYLITSALQDVITQGTGRAATILNRRDIAGKTGTTNDEHDAWFAGFNHDLVAVSWMGFDQPQTIGEYAAETALPLWIDFMRGALAGKPLSVMPQPAGVVSARIDATTGMLASANQKNTVVEWFRKDQLPDETAAAEAPEAANDGNAQAAADHLY